MEGEDISRLRALAALMRTSGLTRLALPDGTVMERPALSPFELAQMSESSRPATSEDPDNVDVVAKEDRERRELEAEWAREWERITASSGAAVPPFPGVNEAARFLGGRRG